MIEHGGQKVSQTADHQENENRRDSNRGIVSYVFLSGGPRLTDLS